MFQSASQFAGQAPPKNAPISCGVLIRTYSGDAPWLYWCLQAFNKYASGYVDKVIVAPESDAHVIAPMAEKAGFNFKPCENHPNGYLHQQVTKMKAEQYVVGEFICIFDSDCLFTRPSTPSDFFRRGKPLIHMESYGYLPPTVPWRKPTRLALGLEGLNPSFEFMRRHPFVYPRWFFEACREQICVTRHVKDVADYILAQPDRLFSEFNVLGAYAWYWHQAHFAWRKIAKGEKLKPPIIRQFWSHGGITPEVEIEIRHIMREERGMIPSHKSQTAEPLSEPMPMTRA